MCGESVCVLFHVFLIHGLEILLKWMCFMDFYIVFSCIYYVLVFYGKGNSSRGEKRRPMRKSLPLTPLMDAFEILSELQFMVLLMLF